MPSKNLYIINAMVFISTYAKKHYDIKFQKHPKYSLRSAAHGDKRENWARNAVELRKFVEISRERMKFYFYFKYINTKLYNYLYRESTWSVREKISIVFPSSMMVQQITENTKTKPVSYKATCRDCLFILALFGERGPC